MKRIKQMLPTTDFSLASTKIPEYISPTHLIQRNIFWDSGIICRRWKKTGCRQHLLYPRHHILIDNWVFSPADDLTDSANLQWIWCWRNFSCYNISGLWEPPFVARTRTTRVIILDLGSINDATMSGPLLKKNATSSILKPILPKLWRNLEEQISELQTQFEFSPCNPSANLSELIWVLQVHFE